MVDFAEMGLYRNVERIQADLQAAGIGPDDPVRPEDLTPYDQYHYEGTAAVDSAAAALSATSDSHLLDVGAGIGGPARYMATRFGCHVTGLDLTAEFCDVARHLTTLLGLEDKVAIEEGDALAMPFADASFDGAFSMNVSMNIVDRAALYQEIHRVLRPGAWLALSEIAKGPGGEVDFPTPWSKTAATSFLSTPEATRTGLEAAGFIVASMHDTKEASLAYGARSRALVERGEKPPHRAVHLIHGDIAKAAAANTARGLEEGCLLPIEILCQKQGA